MNYWKKALALIMVMLIVARLLMCNVYALAGPTVIASEELAVYLTELLMGAGHSASELDGLGNDDLRNMLQNDIDSGNIDPSTFNTSSLSSGQTGGNFFSEAFSKIWNQAQENGGDLYDFINPTKVDSGYTALEGCGVLQQPGSNGWYYIYYGVEPGQLYYNGNEISAYIRYNHYEFTAPAVIFIAHMMVKALLMLHIRLCMTASMSMIPALLFWVLGLGVKTAPKPKQTMKKNMC